MNRFGLSARLGTLLLLATTFFGAAPEAGEWNGKLSFEGRIFPRSALGEDSYGGNLSLAFEPEWYQEWSEGRQSFLLVAFGRLDQNDPERTDWDVRELTWQWSARAFEVRAGVRRVFWGVTESRHLVDIINQTDLNENIDSETKLGQPMVNLAIIRSFGTFDVFALLGFRERRFFGSDSRPGIGFPLDTENPIYESESGRSHVDWAARWSHAFGAWDLGVSHFHGTSRDPRFLPDPSTGDAGLVPIYDLIDQTGLDLQMTHGGWLWKLEAINRFGQGDRYYAFTGGFEYTFGTSRAPVSTSASSPSTPLTNAAN